MKEKIMKFMYGRYGNDELNQFLIKMVFADLLLSLLFKKFRVLSNLLYYIGIILVIFTYFRIFSKNYSRRYKEKIIYLDIYNKLKKYINNKNINFKQSTVYRFYKCPSCNQKIRVPKGKGKISIHCPKCGVDFIKKS